MTTKKLKPREAREVEEIFRILDKDGSNGLNLAEFREYCAVQGEQIKQEDFIDLLAAFKQRGKGLVSDNGELTLQGVIALLETEYGENRTRAQGDKAVKDILHMYKTLQGTTAATNKNNNNKADVVIVDIDDDDDEVVMVNSSPSDNDDTIVITEPPPAKKNAFDVMMRKTIPPPVAVANSTAPSDKPITKNSLKDMMDAAKASNKPKPSHSSGVSTSPVWPSTTPHPYFQNLGMKNATHPPSNPNDCETASLDTSYLPSVWPTSQLSHFPLSAKFSGNHRVENLGRMTSQRRQCDPISPLPQPYPVFRNHNATPPTPIQHVIDNDKQPIPNSLAWIQQRHQQAAHETQNSWTTTYRPTLTHELIGNQSAIANASTWIIDFFDSLNATPTNTNEDAFAAEREFYNDPSWFADTAAGAAAHTAPVDDTTTPRVGHALILVGPSGCGKTTFVYACAHELDLDVKELNASDDVAGSSKLKTLVGETAQSHTLSTHDKGLRRSLILLDEVDFALHEDNKFLIPLKALISTSKIPIVLTCNDLIPDLIGLGQIIQFEAINDTMVDEFVRAVCVAEEVDMTSAVVIPSSGPSGDVRSRLTHAQFWKSNVQYMNPAFTPSAACSKHMANHDAFGIISPVVDSVAPRQASTGQVIKIRGRGFLIPDAVETRVFLDKMVCTNVKAISDSLITATVPSFSMEQDNEQFTEIYQVSSDEDDPFIRPTKRRSKKNSLPPKRAKLRSDVVVEIIIGTTPNHQRVYRSDDTLEMAHNSFFSLLCSALEEEPEDSDDDDGRGDAPVVTKIEPRQYVMEEEDDEQHHAMTSGNEILTMVDAIEKRERNEDGNTWAYLGTSDRLVQENPQWMILDAMNVSIMERQEKCRQQYAELSIQLGFPDGDDDALSGRFAYLQKMCRLECVHRATSGSSRYRSYMQKRLSQILDVEQVAGMGLCDDGLDNWRAICGWR